MKTRRTPGEKYLAQYADLRSHDVIEKNYEHVVVVPARNENHNIDPLLASVASASPNALTIVVVNSSEQCEPTVQDDNLALLERLNKRADVLALDATSPNHRIAKKGGVGTARKIGADVAFALMEEGKVASPYLYCTDADALVPRDYFSRIESQKCKSASAYLFPLTHSRGFPQVQEDALSAYEISFRLYALGLLHAGSPYAFLTVGSTIVVDKDAYLKVRGVPKKAAGEDFHLLNKLAKVGPIVQLGGEALIASGRFSKRVPFGTGQAVLKTHAHLVQDAAIDWPSYDPVTYEILKEGLQGLDEAIQKGSLEGVDFGRALTIFQSMKTLESIEGLLSRPLKNRALAVHSAFDALRTLQFIHAVRDHVAPSLDARRAAHLAPFIADFDADDYESVLSSLRKASVALETPIGPTL